MSHGFISWRGRGERKQEERGEKGVVYTKMKSVWHYLYSNMFVLSEDRASSEVPIGHVKSVQSPNTH